MENCDYVYNRLLPLGQEWRKIKVFQTIKRIEILAMSL